VITILRLLIPGFFVFTKTSILTEHTDQFNTPNQYYILWCTSFSQSFIIGH